jgi:cardiolipin synthase
VGGLFVWTGIGLLLSAALVRSVWRWRGEGRPLGVADWLTAARLALIAPTAWLLGRGDYVPAAVCYCVLLATDVADGVIARRRAETSHFGTFLDPLADVLSTFAVFTALAAHGLLPAWLYLLLVIRYLMLGVGSMVLSRRSAPMEFHATIPGKIVGVIQASVVLWVLRAAAAGRDRPPGDGPLFAFLGLGFVSIVVSQAIIGYRHIRRAGPRARG